MNQNGASGQIWQVHCPQIEATHEVNILISVFYWTQNHIWQKHRVTPKIIERHKGSHHERKVQFFFNIVQKAFDPPTPLPPLLLNIMW